MRSSNSGLVPGLRSRVRRFDYDRQSDVLRCNESKPSSLLSEHMGKGFLRRARGLQNAELYNQPYSKSQSSRCVGDNLP